MKQLNLLSVDNTKPKTATKEQLIEDLRAVALAYPEKFISRNFYRVEGSFSEAAYSSVFGSFTEYKRQAGLILSRHAATLERQVGKHASVENFKEMNVQKAGYEDKYLIPNTSRFQTHMVITDVHDIECDLFTRACFLDAAKRIQPAKIIFGGDLFDLPEFSKYTNDPREWDVVGRIKWVHEFLSDVRTVAPNAELTLVAGNHEQRLLKHLAEATPAMKAILSDLHGFTVPKLLGLDDYQVNYLDRGDLATFTKSDQLKELSKNYMIVDNSYIVHHFPEGRALGMPGINGHHHRYYAWSEFNPTFGSYTWHQLGAAHKRSAPYCEGEKWNNGFMIVHLDVVNKKTQFEYISTTEDHCVIGGKWYERATT